MEYNYEGGVAHTTHTSMLLVLSPSRTASFLIRRAPVRCLETLKRYDDEPTRKDLARGILFMFSFFSLAAATGERKTGPRRGEERAWPEASNTLFGMISIKNVTCF